MTIRIIALMLLPAFSALSFSAVAEEDLRTLIKSMSAQMTELSNQVKQSNQRITELEAKLAQIEKEKALPTTPSTGQASSVHSPASTGGATSSGNAIASSGEGQTKPPAVTVGDAKGTFKIPGTDTSIGIGGFVKLDANISSIGMQGDKLGDQQLVAGQIPVGDNRLGGHSKNTFQAKESRFWLKSFTPSGWGDINTFLELDLLGAPAVSNYAPRLRHAYGSIGNFLAGQTWSTFLNVAAIGDTLDSGGSVGALVYLRQPQVRWTQPFSIGNEHFEFQTALESPKSRLWADPKSILRTNPNAESTDDYGFNNPNDERYPDMIARLNYNPEWGSLSIAGMALQIRYGKQRTVQEDGDWGGAVSLAGKINTIGMDNLRFMLNYGNALGRYATVNTFEDAALAADGHLQLIKVYGGTLAYQHWWDKTWRSTLAYGFVMADQPAFVREFHPTLSKDEMTRQAQSVHANLLWSPISQITVGMEYIYALRERVDGQEGDLHRLTFSTRFNF